MDLLERPADAASWSAAARLAGRTVGFVPTMGALHAGHLALVEAALRRGHRVVASIFVNPLQFNDPGDLAAYPRQLERDRELLAGAGCHALFTPTAQALFHGFTPATYDLGGIDRHWEGPSRPGHFQGVVNVVRRLFLFVRPDEALLGEKDRQQLTILRHVARTQRWPEHLVGHPTVREADGLALSSRNMRLSPTQRRQATVLYRALCAVADHAWRVPVNEALAAGHAVLATEPAVVLDHLGIADADDLRPMSDWGPRTEAVALVAAQVGPVRLIDNVTLRRV